MMKIRLQWTALVAVPVLLALAAAGPASAVSLSLVPASSQAGPGDSVSLDLVIDGLGDFAPASLGDFDVDVGYDPARLSFVGSSLGTSLGDIALGEAVDFGLGDLGGGIINLAEVSLLEPDAASCVFCTGPYLDDLQPASFVLATLDFLVTTLPPGASTIVSIAAVNALGDGFGAALPLTGTADALIRNPAGGAVPEPATLVLLGAGFVGLWTRGRKRAS